MDERLRKLKRIITQSPHDVEGLHRYIGELERVLGGAPECAQKSGREGRGLEKRPGWDCPPSYEPWMGNDDPSQGPSSPDGVCVYFSEPGEYHGYPGRRVVELLIDGQWVWHPLDEGYEPDYETDDTCIFCGFPDERK